MSYTGPQFFDDEQVFATYAQRRTNSNNANDLLERPIFTELVGTVHGLRILDLGCGDAAFGRDALTQGCAAYTGIEGAEKMAELAHRTLTGTVGRVIVTDMERWSYPTEQFDLVISRLALHYVTDLASLCRKVQGALVSGGRFIFSVEHPVITSCNTARPGGDEKRQGWLVDDYFNTGPRLVKWLGSEVVKVHRTVEDYFLTLQAAGFMVETLREARPDRALFTDQAEYERRQRIPLMLFLVGRRTPMADSPAVDSPA